MWFTAVRFGSHKNCFPRGPWRSKAEAETALVRWRERLGWRAGSIEAMLTRRLYGYRSRAEALAGAISDDLGEGGRVE